MKITDQSPRVVAHAGRAFTLVEMLLVLVILATLAGLVYPRLAGQALKARIVATHSQIDSFRGALDAFEMDNDRYPRTRPGLMELVQRPQDAKRWRGPYLQKGIPKDAWKNDYIYECPGRHNPDGYDLYSAGPDGIAGTEDDITSWESDKKD